MPKNTAQRGVIVPKIAPISGRAYGFRSSYSGTTTTLAVSANNLYGVPFYVPANVTVNRIEANITTAAAAGKLLRLGLYDADPATGLPRTLLADSGALAADPGAPPALVGATIAATLVVGALYYLAVVSDGTPTLTATTATTALFGGTDAAAGFGASCIRAFTYAALPAAWGTPASYGTAPFNITVRAV